MSIFESVLKGSCFKFNEVSSIDTVNWIELPPINAFERFRSFEGSLINKFLFYSSFKRGI